MTPGDVASSGPRTEVFIRVIKRSDVPGLIPLGREVTGETRLAETVRFIQTKDHVICLIFGGVVTSDALRQIAKLDSRGVFEEIGIHAVTGVSCPTSVMSAKVGQKVELDARIRHTSRSRDAQRPTICPAS